jgi:cytochrome P450
VALNYIQRSDVRWSGASGSLSPSAFNPTRFLASEGRAQGAQLVFGAGRRSCIGAALAMADIKVLLAVMARGYGFALDRGSTQWQVRGAH